MRRPRRNVRVLLSLATVLLLTQGVTVNCSSPDDDCEGPGDRIDSTSDRPAGELPTWAIGGFGRHVIDVENLWIEADGTAVSILDGGDYGGCSIQTAVFVGGRVHLVPAEGSIDAPHSVLVRTTDGRFFEGPNDIADLNCGWAEFQGTNLCGRDVGGCGGYGSSVACEWDEVGSTIGCWPPLDEADGAPADGGDSDGGDSRAVGDGTGGD